MLVLSVPRYNILLFLLLFDLYLCLFIDTHTLIISQLFDRANHRYDYAWPRNFCRLVFGVVVCLSAKGLMSWTVVKRFICNFVEKEIQHELMVMLEFYFDGVPYAWMLNFLIKNFLDENTFTYDDITLAWSECDKNFTETLNWNCSNIYILKAFYCVLLYFAHLSDFSFMTLNHTF